MDLLDNLPFQSISELLEEARLWLVEYILVPSIGVQAVIVALTLAISWFLAPRFINGLRNLKIARTMRIVNGLILVASPLIWLLLIWFFQFLASFGSYQVQLLSIVASLLTAWVVIRLASELVRHPTTARSIAWFAWIIAALNILQLLNPVIEVLDSRSIMMGTVRVSPYTFITTVLVLTIFLWLASQASSFFAKRVRANTNLSPSAQVLLTKTFTIFLIGLAIITSLQSVGINLTALAFIGGALGLGLGFGLQKIVANLVSGLILLLDKSIKPGDVIAVDDTYGWVDALGARYISVITRDGTEHLIPNETLITERVENWTHSNNSRRIKLPLGVHYNSDVLKAIEVCKEAAVSVERVIASPPPVCLVTEFGDNSVNLEVRFWIQDAHNGLANVKSDVMLKIWAAFHEHGIEIPYPQRDVHVHYVKDHPFIDPTKD